MARIEDHPRYNFEAQAVMPMRKTPGGRELTAHIMDASEVKPDANPSGIFPTVGVVVLPKDVEKVTPGGIIRPPETVDKLQLASMEGVIVAVSPLAFVYADDTEWRGAKPAIGDRVMFARYAGLRQKGADGKDYIVMSDKDLVAVLK